MIKKIGVLTGGGDCPGLNAVLRAVVKTAMGKYEWEVIGFKDGYRGLVMNDYIKFNSRDVSGILDKGGTILGSSNRDNPFNFRLEKDGKVEYKDLSERVMDNVSMHEIDCMVLIGGDGTLTSARDFARKGLKVVGVPKTIDNDLSATDTTFGFMTAVETATEAIDKLHSTAEAHHRVMILEVMGRYAGWIALESGIAGGADVILLPEIPYNINSIVDKIAERKQQGKLFSIIVVAEGAKPKDGDVVISKIVENSPDPIRLGGIGNRIADDIEKATGHETRVTVLGHLQRGGRPVPYDRILSTRYGVAAVELINEGKFGKMVALQGNSITDVSLEDAVGKLKTVDINGELIKIARSVGVGFGD
ncbi:6-phosphofructokinase [Pseudobacteroides cellulosolvens]|uniref:ATP-dependent 6-phosphofructokinase n=1 Tax=Pseudobacteroides cellulosolvens ATCC 35603 = DSM 2933 TaxID=398512 RepID=A0A0L6JT33_9FIRM|nr:6-phosphofructokinase [Pseudobacteroides cellulosolvens]KNY28582.1 6-phosphofructokinase [Pseudobacteroides cellulosolvens ATCC 35603 = DSM 2933]